jgi:hypothetical protein
VSKVLLNIIVKSKIKANREQVLSDTIVKTEIKAKKESVKDTYEQALLNITPKSELLLISLVSTQKPKKRKQEN